MKQKFNFSKNLIGRKNRIDIKLRCKGICLDYIDYIHRCEEDSSTHYLSQSNHETQFVFQAFEVVGTHHDLYVTCEAVVCDTTDAQTTQQCDQTPTCS